MFRRVPTGEVTLAYVAGVDCGCEDGTCASWCATGRTVVEVPRGLGPFETELVVTPPRPREVSLPLSGLDASLPLAARLGPIEGERVGGALRFAAVPPGLHALTLTAGSCPEGTSACWPEGACPPGCAIGERSVEVPVEGAPSPAELVVAVAPVVASPAPPTTRPAPGPAPAPRPRSGWATVGMLESFLRDNPSWGPGSARARAGGSGYLRGWTEAGPPPGASSGAPATGVTGELARKVCQASGLDLADTTDLSDATDLELRREGEVVRIVERPEGGEARLVPIGNLAVTGARWRCRR